MEKIEEVLVIFKFWPRSYTCKTVKVVEMIKYEGKHDLQVFSWWMEQNQFVLDIFNFWPKSHTRTLAEIFKLTNFEVLSAFTLKLWKSFKTIKFKCKDDLQVSSWWMEKIEEVLVIFKFWPRSYTWTLAENLKIDWFWSLSSFTVKLWKSVQMIKFECKHDLQVFFNELNRFKKF